MKEAAINLARPSVVFRLEVRERGGVGQIQPHGEWPHVVAAKSLKSGHVGVEHVYAVGQRETIATHLIYNIGIRAFHLGIMSAYQGFSVDALRLCFRRKYCTHRRENQQYAKKECTHFHLILTQK